jgi:hypothetical protein
MPVPSPAPRITGSSAFAEEALDVLRTAEQPMTATDIARKMLETHSAKNAGKTEAKFVAQGILRGLLSHTGKGVQNVAEGKPAKWTLKRENAA